MIINQDLATFCRVLELFESRGWFPGSLGGGALKLVSSRTTSTLYMTPENTPKINLSERDFYKFKSIYGSFDTVPPIDGVCVPSKWSPLFLSLLSDPNITNAFVVCSNYALLAAKLAFHRFKLGEQYPSSLRLERWNTLYNICNTDEITIPIVDWNPDSGTLLKSIAQKIKLASHNVLIIRDYGLLIWGNDILNVKNTLEIIEKTCELQALEFKNR